MIRIYKDNINSSGFYIREGSNVAIFHSRNKEIKRSTRVELLLKTSSLTECKPGTKAYEIILKSYQNLLANFPLPGRYDFHVLKKGTPSNMERQVEQLKTNPYWNCL